jgi:L-amino acid N-acyltransferase YncA
MEKKETLKDGRELTIRELKLADLDKLMKFYCTLPPGDRKYLRIDVTNRDIVEQRIRMAGTDNIIRIIALFGEEIVADGALELTSEEARKHLGELRVIVARKFQRQGVGMAMMRELYLLAVEKKVEKIVVKMMRPQIEVRKICRKLGFREELLIPDYVRDLGGESQDLVIMTCDIKEMWKELDLFYSDSDWQRCR